jgi:hypothetical protein
MTTTYLPPQTFGVDSQGVTDLDPCEPLIVDAQMDARLLEGEAQSFLEENKR